MKNMKKLIACMLGLALIMSSVPVVETQAAAKGAALNSSSVILVKGKSTTIKVKNVAEKASWAVISGSECISIRKNGNTVVVKGKKYGAARLQAVVSGKKYVCIIDVVCEGDAKALNDILTKQKKAGGLKGTEKGRYTWKNGRLTRIYWQHAGFVGALDVSKLTALDSLDVSNNQLTSLNVSGNPKLEWLSCSGNRLTMVDVSKNQKLKVLNCDDNQLASLNVSKNQKLDGLYCCGNRLASLDVSGNQKLTSFDCTDNQLTSLDISKNRKLEWLNCSGN